MSPRSLPPLPSRAGCGPAGVAAVLRRVAPAGLALLVLAAPAPRARAADDAAAAPAERAPVSSVREYTIPAVRVVRDDGRAVSLPEEMDDGRPVVLNFVFTTCTTICPMMSSVFEQFAHRLGAEAGKVHLMSISIDPEQDTPARLAEYARKFHAGPGWQHYTGTLAASVAAQKAFDVYRGGKMSHTLVTLMRAAPGKPWLRLDGFATPEDLLRSYRELMARPEALARPGQANARSGS